MNSLGRMVAYWTDDDGWHKARTNDPVHLLRTVHATGLARGEVTHWAICSVDKDDGGLTPPPGVPIYDEES